MHAKIHAKVGYVSAPLPLARKLRLTNPRSGRTLNPYHQGLNRCTLGESFLMFGAEPKS